MKKQKLIAITGPSSSGKTALAIALSKELNGEIISVDSRQIYKGLDIGSAKPTIEERENIPHHLMDIIEVTEPFTAADFSDKAKEVIADIQSRGKTAILAGGTGLYFRILLQDFDLPRVAPNPDLRNELEQLPTEELYKILVELDNEIAQKIHFNNKVKIIRAIEVCKTLGIPMSKAQKKKESEYNVLWCGLNFNNRELLYERVNKRVDLMLEAGLLEEAKKLFADYKENNILMNTIGYQELYPYLKGEIELSLAIEQLKQNTRRYAKRQISWFNANKDIIWFNLDEMPFEAIKSTIIEKYKNL